VYLLDTNVISELRRPRPHGAVSAWLRATADEDLHLSAVTLGELQAGVEITGGQDPEKATEIEGWIDQVAQTWNVLPVDPLLADALIAATAIVHHLTVVTRNVRDFVLFEVGTLDPFKFS
jgi:predicted nucleic acid-binding protein